MAKTNGKKCSHKKTCERYTTMGTRRLNKIRKIKKHLKTHATDILAKKTLSGL